MRYRNCEIHNSHSLKGGGHKVRIKSDMINILRIPLHSLFGHLESKQNYGVFGEKEMVNDYGVTWVITLYIFIFNMISTIFIFFLKLSIEL